MSEAKRDNNGVQVMTGVLSSDGVTPTMVKADPTTHFIKVDDNTTGSDLGADNAARDGNYVTTLIAVSEVDGVTPVPIYVSADGEILIDST